MTFAPEILQYIFRHLENRSLFNVRLACKSFEEAASPFLFDQIYISSFRTDLEVAKLTVLRFGRYIRTLVFALNYLDYLVQQFRDSLRQKSCSNDIEPPSCFHQSLKNACDRYIGRHAEWREVNKSGELLSHLCFFLGKMPRLETIKITTSPLFGYKSRESLQLPGAESACSGPARILYNEALGFEPWHRWQNAVSVEDGTDAWRHLMHALSTTKSYVKHIALHQPYGNLPISCTVFQMSQAQALDWGECFRCLTTLRLTLCTWYQDSTYDAGIQEKLSSALAAASNLEQLTLDSESREWLFFEHFLRGCRFPKLISLDLSHIDVAEEQLVDFLGSSPSLENLSLYMVSLSQGSWERVVGWIRLSLQLHCVCFRHISGESPHPDEGDEIPGVLVEQIEEFILFGGENPFTEGKTQVCQD